MSEVAGLAMGALSADICSREVRRPPVQNKLNKGCSYLRGVTVVSQ